MFKIIDKFDLKGLESFGYEEFDFDYEANKPIEPPIYVSWIKKINKKRNIKWIGIFIENRIIELRECYEYHYTIKKRIRKMYIQNLIDFGIVEKVEDKGE